MQAKLLDGSLVALRIFSTDIDDMTKDEFEWVKSTAVWSGPMGSERNIITYNVPITSEHYVLLGRRNWNTVTPSFFFIIKRLCDGEDFTLNGYDAHDAVTAIYAEGARVLSPRADNWAFSTEGSYELSYSASSKTLAIKVPDQSRGLLIGRSGASTDAVQDFLWPIVSRLQIL